MIVYVIWKIGANNYSPNSINVMVNWQYQSENRVITRWFLSILDSIYGEYFIEYKKYILYKNKAIIHQLDFSESFLQANVKHGSFVRLYSRYREYFPEYCNYFGRPLRLKKSMYGINIPGKIFAYLITNRMINKARFKQSKCQIYIYYKYAPDWFKLFLLSYVDDCVYWYTHE